jgi:hypothetical protein
MLVDRHDVLDDMKEYTPARHDGVCLDRLRVGQSCSKSYSDPNSHHAEESWAVAGFTDHDARELGAKYRQVAVFRITATRQTVLGCFAEWEVGRGV